MKIALITDTHYGFKKGNQEYHDYFLKFYNEVFFPTLKKKKIKHVIHLGDVFDIRRNIDFWSLDWARKNIFNPLQDMGVTVDVMVGNHDSFYKNTLEINSLECLLQEYDNLRVYTQPSEVTVGDRKMVYLPWICDQNEKQTVNLLKQTDAEVVLGHLEMEGFKTNPTYTANHGRQTSEFSKFELVMSGHYHTKSKKGNFQYLGNPYQMYWNDYKDSRGFHIYDTESDRLRFVANPYEIFEKIFYDDAKYDYNKSDVSDYKDKFIKIIVEEKRDYQMFETLVDRLYNVGAHDVKIVETLVDADGIDDTDLETKDTMTLLNEYIDEVEISVDKSELKKLMRNLYIESCQVV